MNILNLVWIVTHILSFGFISKQRIFFLFLLLFIFVIFYFNIGLIGDMKNGYFYEIMHIDNSSRFIYRFELGFVFLVNVFYDYFKFTNIETLYVLQLFEIIVGLYVAYLYSLNKNSFLYSVIFLLGSVYLFLGVENGYRQGVSVMFILLFVYFFVQKVYIKSFLFALLAQSFHYSSIFFIIILLLSFFIINKKQENYRISDISFFLKIVFISLVTFIMLKLLSNYFPISRNNDRNLGLVKVVIIGFVFAYTSYFYIKRLLFDRLTFVIFWYRAVFFSIFVASAILGGHVGEELSSRILFFYFALEAILILRVFSLKSLKLKLINLSVFLFYGIAINVHILLTQVEL